MALFNSEAGSGRRNALRCDRFLVVVARNLDGVDLGRDYEYLRYSVKGMDGTARGWQVRSDKGAGCE